MNFGTGCIRDREVKLIRSHTKIDVKTISEGLSWLSMFAYKEKKM